MPFQRVARALRYRPLTDMCGKSVTITSPESVVETVQRAFQLGPHQESSPVEGTMAKYDLLDLVFVSEAHWLPADQGGVSRLLELGFVARERDTEALEDEDYWLKILEESIRADVALLKLFLEAKKPAANPNRLEFRLAPDYLPREFVVVDACVTNSDYVWFHKHFYL